MRKVKFAMMILAASLLTACGSSKKEQSVNEETAAARTQETENLLANLKKIPSKGIMLGHHDDTVYGISGAAWFRSVGMRAIPRRAVMPGMYRIRRW